jgi:hypothetical protein
MHIQFRNSKANMLRRLKIKEKPNKTPTQTQYQCHSFINPLTFRAASPVALTFPK